MLRPIHRDPGDRIVDAAAQIGRISQLGIDDQFPAAVVGPDLEAQVLFARQDKTPIDGLLDLSRLLVDDRSVESDRVLRLEAQDRVAFRVQREAFRSLEVEEDAAGVGSGRDDEVMFQRPLVPIIDQVDAGVDLPELHLGILLHADLPFRGVAADEIAGMPGQDIAS